jgi:hypothetical protein
MRVPGLSASRRVRSIRRTSGTTHPPCPRSYCLNRRLEREMAPTEPWFPAAGIPAQD